jgi:CheY-like chemotaxis protein
MASVGQGFTVALIDLDLPDVDGFELIGTMRKHFPDLPIIAVSGVVRRHVLESAKSLGADEVLPKPITGEWKDAIDRVQKARSGQ